MKINLVSDLHLEFCPIILGATGETLLLAGDIVPVHVLEDKRTDRTAVVVRDRVHALFHEISQNFDRIFWIMGNHEHYSGTIELDHKIIRNFLTEYPKIKLMNNISVALTAKTQLFGGTLWTDLRKLDPIALEAARHSMNDFRGSILHDYKANGSHQYAKFTPEDSVEEHKFSLRRLNKELALWPDKEFLVMTHHCPTYRSIHPKYGTDPLNYAFSSDLSDLILDNPRIKRWVHGHTHDTFKYDVGGCQVLCNPRGYTRNPNVPPENAAFDPTFSFEVE